MPVNNHSLSLCPQGNTVRSLFVCLIYYKGIMLDLIPLGSQKDTQTKMQLRLRHVGTSIYLVQLVGTTSIYLVQLVGTTSIYLVQLVGTTSIYLVQLVGTTSIYLVQHVGTTSIYLVQLVGKTSIYLVQLVGTISIYLVQLVGTTSSFLFFFESPIQDLVIPKTLKIWYQCFPCLALNMRREILALSQKINSNKY